MTKLAVTSYFIILFCVLWIQGRTQDNVGIGTITPVGKLHLKGSQDVSQLVIDANVAQSDTNPLIKLRNHVGIDLMWLHSNHFTNCFIGLKAGRNNSDAYYNTFIGTEAGQLHADGEGLTAIGYQSMQNYQYGSQNTSVGFQALK